MARIENISEFRRLVDEGYIFMNKHEKFDLWICKYTRTTVLNGVWNDLTMMCRGLVIDADYNIVARPFRKFFNFEEITDKSVIPVNLPFEIYDKLDGSLGILYFGPDGMPYIATQGSFSSEQAQHANKVLYERYSGVFPLLDRSKTYLFEIIYPEDLHIVTYNGVDEDVQLITTGSIFAALPELSADYVYNMLDCMTKGIDEVQAVHGMTKYITPENMVKMRGVIPWHAGAEKFFKE